LPSNLRKLLKKFDQNSKASSYALASNAVKHIVFARALVGVKASLGLKAPRFSFLDTGSEDKVF